MKTQQLVENNNERRQLLSPENLKAYEDALVYIRLHAGRSEHEIESVLLELLEHLIEAQENGKGAVEVFGEDLEGYCDGLIEQIPKQSGKSMILDVIYYATLMLGGYFAIQTLFQFISFFVPELRTASMSIVPFIALLLLGGAELLILLSIMKSAVFQPRFRMMLAGVSGVVTLGLFVGISMWAKNIWTVPVNLWSMLAVTILLIALSRLFKHLSSSR